MLSFIIPLFLCEGREKQSRAEKKKQKHTLYYVDYELCIYSYKMV